LGDKLTYRFPGKEIIYKLGHFVQLRTEQEPNGFVVSNLDLSICYQFEEADEIQPGLHLLENRPYCMSAREYYLQAHELLNGINLMQMGKAVFSRVKAVTFDPTLTEKLFEELCETYPNALVYLISGKEIGTWIGATPEILLEVHKGYLFSVALAGTKKTEDQSEWTEKEKVEQEIVSDYIRDICIKKKLKNLEIEGPYDSQAGPVTHLRSDISAEMNGVNSWEMARALHPTPAVAGFPKNQSLSLISTVEPHRRELYTGIIGLISPDSAKLFVNLRCAQVQENTLFLYLGGGYTPQSIPELEWVETENKSKTLLNCVQKISK